MSTLFSWANKEEKLAAYKNANELIAKDSDEFWRIQSQMLLWSEPFHTVHNKSFKDGKWFLGGKLNVSENCLDRHVENGFAEKIAIIFENEQGEVRKISYGQLLNMTCHIAALLQKQGIKPTDRVAIYMPMIPEAIASMLACARIGAIHTVIFGGFSKEALADRIYDCQAKAIITAESSQRKGQTLFLKNTVENILTDKRCASVSCVLCFGVKDKKNDLIIPYQEQLHWPDNIKRPLGFDSEHPLFILYTSGTTGKPKGIFHTTGGYLTQTTTTARWVFDLADTDLYWCTADVGWITGHSYVVYGPLALGKSIFMYEGALNWPDSSRIYNLIDKHKITVLYTAPTAIRMFMQAGEQFKKESDLSSLRLLGSVGEPINPEAWLWYRRVFGNNRTAIVDSWWQTETGAMMIVPIEHASNQKPGSASRPFLGIDAQVVNEQGQPVKTNESGFLVIKKPWPSLARGIWGDMERFYETYFNKIPGVYFTGDGAKMDADGDFIISGRIDDVINVAGHRLGTAEIESALVSHSSVAEAAVVGIPDEITFEAPVAFVILKNGINPQEQLVGILKEHVKACIGSFAKPAEIHFKKSLPKTRSGKIMRRLLRAMAKGEKIESDISTLDDASALT